MASTKNFFSRLALMLALCVSVSLCNAGTPCVLNCSESENVVWSTDGHRCFPWRNDCYLANQNCERQNRKEPVLTVINKTECQKLCNVVICTMQYSPVCAEYKGKTRTFGNDCLLTLHICTTGETYKFISNGECKDTNLEV